MPVTDLDPIGKLPFTLTADPALAQAIATNAAFPADTTGKRIIGQLGFSTPDGSWNVPGMGAQPVSVSASAATGALFAAYTDAVTLASDLGLGSDAAKQLDLQLPAGNDLRYITLQLTLAASAAGSGSLVLEPGVQVNFGAKAAANSQLAVVRVVPAAEPAGDAVRSLVSGWMTPGDLAKGATLPAGVWVIAQADGKLSADLGVQAGYDVNWVRSVGLNELDGDIGLRIALGLKASLSCVLQGSYCVVISRDAGATATRVRLYRSAANGLGFGLNTSAAVTPSATFSAADLDGFVQAVLGIHDAQLLSFLSAANTTDAINALGNEFFTRLGIAGDATAAFAQVSGLLSQWNTLPNAVATVVWKYADAAGLDKLRSAATQLATLSSASIKTLLDGYLHDTAYGSNAVVEWLEAASSTTLFNLYEGEPVHLQAYAQQLLKLLDGSALETLLAKLKTSVDTALDLPALEAALTAGNLAGMAGWVQGRLAKFLGVDTSKLTANTGKIEAAVKTIRVRANDLYAATLKALNTTYGVSLSLTCDASTLRTALIDASFVDGKPAAQAALRDVLLGKLSAVLAAPVDGVTLNAGVLSHGVQRTAHVEVHLPWYTGVADELASSEAFAKFADGVDGRVQLFHVNGFSAAQYQQNENLKRFATMSVGISGLAPGVRKYNVRAVNFGYTFMTEGVAMTSSQLEYGLRDAVAAYFPNTFGGPGQGTFDAWITDLDKATDALALAAGAASGAQLGSGSLGTVWASLQVNLRAGEGTDWVGKLLSGAQPDYYAMSRSMQGSIRRWMLVSYGANPAHFGDIDLSEALLVYTSLPALNDVSLNDGELTLKPAGKGDIVWDMFDASLVSAICSTYALPGVVRAAEDAGALLNGIPALRSRAQFFSGQGRNILQSVLQAEQSSGVSRLRMWLAAESGVIDKAKSAFESLRKAGGKDVASALPQFSSAMIKLVEAFNNDLAKLSMTAPEIMREFAPMILRQAVQDMFGGAAAFDLDALLDVAVLKSTTLPATNEAPGPDDTLLRQRITSFA